MKQPFETQITKNAELIQTLFGLGMQNAQKLGQANQQAAQALMSILSSAQHNVGQPLDFSEAIHVYQEAGEVVTENLAQARTLIEEAAKEMQSSLRSAVDTGLGKLDQSGHAVVVNAIRQSLSQVDTAQEHLGVHLKTVEKAQVEVTNKVKEAVSKVISKSAYKKK